MTEPKKIKGDKRPQGRPSTYTKVLAFKICKRLAEGETLRNICRDPEMPRLSTVMEWNLKDREGFSEQYARARTAQAEHLFDEILEIADDSSEDMMTITTGKGREVEVENREVTNRSRLRVDTRKWYLSKVLPKKFGEKMDVTTDGKAIQGNTIVFKNFSDETNSQ